MCRLPLGNRERVENVAGCVSSLHQHQPTHSPATLGGSGGGLLFPLIPFLCPVGAILPGSSASPPDRTSAEDGSTLRYRRLAPCLLVGPTMMQDSLQSPCSWDWSHLGPHSLAAECSRMFCQSSPENPPPPMAPLRYSCFRL